MFTINLGVHVRTNKNDTYAEVTNALLLNLCPNQSEQTARTSISITKWEV